MGRPQDVVFGWVATVSFVAISLFSLDLFYPLIALLGGSLLFGLIWLLVPRNKTSCGDGLSRADLQLLLLLIVVGLVFRVGPYPYVVGGEDQGVYVNMSYAIDRENGAFHTDPVRSRLTDPQLVEAYDRANLWHWDAADPGAGVFLPGIYVKNLENSEYVFQFYHLHPLWMSIFGSVLGGLDRLYALTFFSILSLIAFYLLTLELFENRLLAFFAGFFLALNPLHAFFSKFPVAEVVALAFLTSGFYYLVRYHRRARRGDDDWRYLLISALLLGCMFFTRISGFMYMPTIWLILMVAVAFEEGQRTRRRLVSYCCGVGILFVVSVAYGLNFSYPYARDIYAMSFSRLLGPEWLVRLFLLLFLLGAGTVAALILLRNEIWGRRFRVLLQKGLPLFPWAFILVGILGLVKVYQLAWGGGDFSYWVIPYWDLAGKGLDSVLRSSLFVAGAYVSPPVAILALTGLFCRAQSRYLTLILAFLLQFVVYAAFLQWVMPYQYWWGRYLLSQIVPFSILVAMAGLLAWWIRPIGRKVAVVLVLSAAGYFLYFTVHQRLGKEANGAYPALEEIARGVDENDLIFMKQGSFEQLDPIRVPLIYVFDKRLVVYENASTVEHYLVRYQQEGGPFEDFFILSPWKTESPMFELVVETVYREGHFERAALIPKRFSYQYEFPLFLYRIREEGFGKEVLEEWVNLSLVKEGFHEDDVWTRGDSKLTGFRIGVGDKRYIVLESRGWNPYRDEPEKLELSVTVGDQVIRLDHQEGLQYFFEIPSGLTEITSLTIHSSTFVPKELGMNDDNRRLGIDFKSISFE
ncbi:MAG TPA: phospholipid carrier-dependent glycosyltransferase [Acidobacteriota bacterium]|nr:phospholipid carrier-dependent glycosyltransferase [Acidobacteriota bacterium]